MRGLFKSAAAVVCAVPCLFSEAATRDSFANYKVRVLEEMRDLDAFENADFEDVSKYGKAGEHAEIGRFGYNGNGGVRVRPCPNQTYGWRLPAKKTLKLKKGVRYVLSSNIKTHGLGCQTCADVFFVNPRKYAFGIWGPASEKMSDGWVRHTVEFVPKWDSDELDYHFMIYCRQPNEVDFTSSDRWVDVDNIAIHTAAPSWYFCNTWPTHNRVFSEEGRVRAHSEFWGPFLDEGADPVYRFRLLSPKGKVVAETTAEADSKGNMTAAFGKIGYGGPAKLSVTLFDRAHRLNLGTREIDVTVGPTPDVTKGLFVRENGVVLRDGKPYMPIGFYTDFAYPDKYTKERAEEQMKKLQDAGFNAMIDYGTYTLKRQDRRDWYYDACERHGIGVLSDLCWTNEAAYHACLGWYTMDEAPESAVPRLTKTRRHLNAAAPDKVVNICNILRPAPYLPCADIQGGDCYPIKHGADLLHCADRMRGMADMAPAAIWYAPQAYNWASMVSGALKDAELYRKSGREPTESEMLSVALLMASYNVKGFFFYSYFDVFRCPVKEWIPKRWDAVCRICACLRDLEPFIMSGKRILEIPVTDVKGRTRVVAMTDGKGHVRVIVIGLGRDNECRFTLDPRLGKPEPTYGLVRKEGDGYVFAGKDFTCDLLK